MKIIQALYEKERDQKDSIYFAHHYGSYYRSSFAAHGRRFPGFHNSIEFAFGLKGSMDILINGEKYVLNAGEICFINSREPHRYYYNEDVECYIVVISSGFFNDVNSLGDISFPSHMGQGDGFDSIKHYLDYAIERWDGSLLCKRAFADTIAYLMRRYYPFTARQTQGKRNEILLDVVKYICEHYTESLTVKDLATRFGYSENYFSRAFNKFMKTSFSDFLNTCRILEYHRIRRQSPEISVAKAAQLCGFGSMNTFYRALQRFEENYESESKKK